MRHALAGSSTLLALVCLGLLVFREPLVCVALMLAVCTFAWAERGLPLPMERKRHERSRYYE